MSNEKRLNRRQEVFIREYLVDLNASGAYARAGFRARGNSAEVNAARLLRNAQVAEAIEKAMGERAQRTKIDADRVLLELARIAFFDLGRAFLPDGTLKPLNEMDEDTRRALSSLEVVALNNGERESIGTLRKIKTVDKLAALEKLGRHLGLWNDKLTLQGNAENPLVSLIQAVQGSSFRPTH
jgi:phage terminase small subunit